MDEKGPIKVMIIEDEQDLLNLYKDFLKSKGYNVLVTNTTAVHIVEDYSEFNPDLVILDYRLPDEKNGIDAAKDLLKNYDNIPILIITAYESIKNTFANETMFKDKNVKLVIKPIKLHQLDKIIREMII
jgi:DNA-binding NtrC family response regulator